MQNRSTSPVPAATAAAPIEHDKPCRLPARLLPTPPACAPWCRTEHRADLNGWDDDDRGDLYKYCRQTVTIDRQGAETTVQLEQWAFLDADSHELHTPALEVQVDGLDYTLDGAAALADALALLVELGKDDGGVFALDHLPASALHDLTVADRLNALATAKSAALESARRAHERSQHART